MNEIYKMEIEIGIITAAELKTYIGMGIITETDYEWIVGDSNANAQTVAPQSQA